MSNGTWLYIGAEFNLRLPPRIFEFFVRRAPIRMKLLPPLLLCTAFATGCGAPEQSAAPQAGEDGFGWQELIDGRSLLGWRRLDFDGKGGEVDAAGGAIALGRGEPFTAIVIDDPEFEPPGLEYEIVVAARKIEGRDFFCALTFPVPEKASCCTFVVGGWGGGVTGLSDIGLLDANRNTTRSVLKYEHGRWYELRVEIRRGRIRCWIDEKLVVNLLTDGKKISVRPGEIEACQPLGLASWETAAEIKSIRVRRLRGASDL